MATIAKRPREPHSTNGYVRDALAEFPVAYDGEAVLVEGSVKLMVSEAEQWYEEFVGYDKRFREWCGTHARTGNVDEIAADFSNTAPLIDLGRQELRWFAWFSDKLASYLAREMGAPEASLRLVDQLKEQIDFECNYNLQKIGNPSLFPPHLKMVELLSGCSPHEGPRPERDEVEEAYRKMTRAWSEAEPTSLKEELKAAVTEVAKTGNYQEMKVYEAYRAAVRQWAADSIGEEEPGFEQAVDRLSVVTMVVSEKVMTKAIEGEAEQRNAPRKLTEERMAALKKGTIYQP